MPEEYLERAVELFEQACRRVRDYDASPQLFYHGVASKAMVSTRLQLDPLLVLATAVHMNPRVVDILHPQNLKEMVREKCCVTHFHSALCSGSVAAALKVAAWLERCRELKKSTSADKSLKAVSVFCTVLVDPPLDPAAGAAYAESRLREWSDSEPVQGESNMDDICAKLHLRVRKAISRRSADIQRRKEDVIAVAAREATVIAQKEKDSKRVWQLVETRMKFKASRRLREGAWSMARAASVSSDVFDRLTSGKNNSKSAKAGKLPVNKTTSKLRTFRKVDAKLAKMSKAKQEVSFLQEVSGKNLKCNRLKKIGEGFDSHSSIPSFKKSKARSGERRWARDRKTELPFVLDSEEECTCKRNQAGSAA